MRLQHVVTTDDVDFVVVGIPYDNCVTFRPGSRFVPTPIREMSVLAAKSYNPALYIGIFDH